MRESDVIGCEVPSVHLESRIVVGRRLPIGMRRSRLEVPTTPEAVALGHLATHVDDLAISGKLPEDSANFQGLELLEWSLSIHEGQTRARTCQNLVLASITQKRRCESFLSSLKKSPENRGSDEGGGSKDAKFGVTVTERPAAQASKEVLAERGSSTFQLEVLAASPADRALQERPQRKRKPLL